ncbi:Uncharacterised protein [Vibrio cholerae]|nr:Uncharacterised protein [Vibrio cholerae]
MLFLHVDGDRFKRFHQLAVFVLQNNFWTRYCQLKAFTTHVFDQDR